MRPLRPRLGTPLEQTQLVDEQHQRKLRALGVTRVEELFGLIQSDPRATGRFLEVSNLAMLQNEAVREATPQLMRSMDRFQEPAFSLGAVPPSDVEIEQQASETTFFRYLEQEESRPAQVEREGVDLRRCFQPVRDQEKRGTCVAHSVVAIMECLFGRADRPADLSEQWLYWLCKERDGVPDDEGTRIDIALESSIDKGVCLEETWVYEGQPIPGNEGQGPPPADAEAHAANWTMTRWEELLPNRSVDAITNALDNERPVAVGVPVYDNWYSNPAANATGNIPMPLPLSILRGGHAMAIVGYDYDEEVPGGAGFIVRNSWGVDWAPESAIEPGYGVLPFPYVEQYGWGAFVVE
jgi:C1A family cysteine protease